MTDTKKVYRVAGNIGGLKLGTTKKGVISAHFKLLRVGKDGLAVSAFGPAAQPLHDGEFGEGDTVRVTGTYEKVSFTGQGGKEVSYDSLSARYVGHLHLPRTISVVEAEQLIELVSGMANKQDIADWAYRKLGLKVNLRNRRPEILEQLKNALNARTDKAA